MFAEKKSFTYNLSNQVVIASGDALVCHVLIDTQAIYAMSTLWQGYVLPNALHSLCGSVCQVL